jgi:transposase
MKKYPRPQLSAAEWRAIKKHIPHAKAGPPPRHDRQILSALAYSIAANCSLEALPEGYPLPSSVRTRVKRWRKSGALDEILIATSPAINRIRIDYENYLHRLSPWGGGWTFGRTKDDPIFANLPTRR